MSDASPIVKLKKMCACGSSRFETPDNCPRNEAWCAVCGSHVTFGKDDAVFSYKRPALSTVKKPIVQDDELRQDVRKLTAELTKLTAAIEKLQKRLDS